ncbi:MAG: dipeptide epimerase, partial [Cytophagia bacterium]|nr:dipeptide epimerase [Cytophagia bacterium]
MKIENIEIDIVDIDLTRPYTIAYKTTSSIKNLVLKIILADGTIGLGASNVSKYVVGMDTMDSYNNSKEYIDELIGSDIYSFWMIINDIESKFINDPGSKAAFNIAVYDAYCKKLGISIGKFLGRKIKSLPTSITVGIKSVEETISEINEYLGLGFNYIKIKLGNNVEEDIRRINIINEKFGNKIKIRIDANQGWSLDDTIKFYNNTKQIELIEQPLSVDELNNYLDFPSEIKKIIALDESL